jgi:hypothetical protein
VSTSVLKSVSTNISQLVFIGQGCSVGISTKTGYRRNEQNNVKLNFTMQLNMIIEPGEVLKILRCLAKIGRGGTAIATLSRSTSKLGVSCSLYFVKLGF